MTDNDRPFLSPEELDMAGNSRIFELKHAIMLKVRDLLERTLLSLTETVFPLPEGITAGTAKFSKGENYRLMPYQVLDFPRFSGGGDLYLNRTVFWWGNHFSCSLTVAGQPLERIRSVLTGRLQAIAARDDMLLCVAPTPWHHDTGADNAQPLPHLKRHEIEAIATRHPFCKLSRVLPLNRGVALPGFATESFRLFNSLFLG